MTDFENIFFCKWKKSTHNLFFQPLKILLGKKIKTKKILVFRKEVN